jgi:hypothetical protein
MANDTPVSYAPPLPVTGKRRPRASIDHDVAPADLGPLVSLILKLMVKPPPEDDPARSAVAGESVPSKAADQAEPAEQSKPKPKRKRRTVKK